MRSKRPNAALKRSSPETISSSGDAQAQRERRGGERVVDVVEPGHVAGATRRGCPGRGELERRRTSSPSSSIARATTFERRPAVPAARTTVVAEMADVCRGVVVRGPAADAVLRVGCVLEGGPRAAEGSSTPKTSASGRSRASSPTCGIVAVDDQRSVAGKRAHRRAPPARRRARARRSGRAGRGRDCRGRPRAAARARRPRAAPPRPPRRGPSSAARASRSVEATPETRFAPELLCARRTRPRRISAAIAAVVVLPFVAEISGGAEREPRGQPVDRRRIELPEQLPGTVVPPPAPARRDKPPRRPRDGDLGGERNRKAQNTGEAIRAPPIPRTGELVGPYR